MRKKRIFVIVTTFLLVFSSLNPTSFVQGTSSEDWKFSAFGSNTSAEKNPPPIINDDGSVTMGVSGGKIASSKEGLSFQYKKVSADENFELKTTAHADAYSPESQRSFGLMVRNGIGENGDSSKSSADYVAVGALDDAVRGFYNQGGLKKLGVFPDITPPATGEAYELSIRKSGNTFMVTSNGESETVSLPEELDGDLYVGYYVARYGTITFSDTILDIHSEELSDLQVDTDEMKTEYLIGESLDLSGINVKAVYPDGSEETLTDGDYFVTGFDSSMAGTNTLTIHYGGVEKTIELIIRDLVLSEMVIKYYPAKTEYYPGDTFDPLGLVVVGNYENGYVYEELSEGKYTLLIDGEEVNSDHVLQEAGTKSVILQANEDLRAFRIFIHFEICSICQRKE